MRQGFSLLTAIIFLVLVATISALTLSFSTQAVKQTSDVFLKSQAELLAQSATEYALLAISGHEMNATNGCVENINLLYPVNDGNYTHEANVSIMYIGNSLPCNAISILSNTLDTNDSNRTVIIDTIVSTNPAISTEPIRIHRRTIQKP